MEAKGFFKPSDRRKMLAVKEQNPELDIRFIFQRNNTLSKNSKTTYGPGVKSTGSPTAYSQTFPRIGSNDWHTQRL